MLSLAVRGSLHLKELLYILAVPMTSIAGLAAFSAWWSALIYFAGIAVFAIYAVRRHERHHRSEVFDDRLSDDRIRSAREWLLEE
jgi:membrane protein implicated in regulation of membrane protease activity